MVRTMDKLTELLAKGYDLTLEDAIEIDVLTTKIDYEDACRALDAARLIICDPLYTGNIPYDYFDFADD